MPRCPNCGKETARTADWACQWCGYPLLSRAYKKIPKTYKQLQEERLGEPRPSLTEELESEPKLELPPLPKYKPAPIPEPEPEPLPNRQARPVLRPEPEPEPVREAPPATISPAEPATVAATIPGPVPAPVPEPVPVPDLNPDPATGVITVTVDQLNAAYQADKMATHDKLTDKTLRVTGTVDKIIVKEQLDIQYLLLAGAAGWGGLNVRCTFAQKYAVQLSRLTPGQTVPIQGKYAGYERNIILKDCLLA